MMSCVFAAMIAAAIICGAANGSIAAVLDALTEGAANAVTLSLSLAGAYMLWMGLMGIARRAGLIDALSRAMRKPLSLLSRELLRRGQRGNALRAGGHEGAEREG